MPVILLEMLFLRSQPGLVLLLILLSGCGSTPGGARLGVSHLLPVGLASGYIQYEPRSGDCGLTALFVAMQHQSVNLTYAKLRNLAGPSNAKIESYRLLQLAQTLGFQGALFQGDMAVLDEVLSTGQPVIAFSIDHAVTVVRKQGQQYLVVDNLSRYLLSRILLRRYWSTGRYTALIVHRRTPQRRP